MLTLAFARGAKARCTNLPVYPGHRRFKCGSCCVKRCIRVVFFRCWLGLATSPSIARHRGVVTGKRSWCGDADAQTSADPADALSPIPGFVPPRGFERPCTDGADCLEYDLLQAWHRWRCTRTVSRRPKNHGWRVLLPFLIVSVLPHAGHCFRSHAVRLAPPRNDCAKALPRSKTFMGLATPCGLLPEPQHGRSARFCQSTRCSNVTNTIRNRVAAILTNV